jgi:hypothetical protein
MGCCCSSSAVAYSDSDSSHSSLFFIKEEEQEKDEIKSWVVETAAWKQDVISLTSHFRVLTNLSVLDLLKARDSLKPTSHKSAFLIRTHAPTMAMISRMKKWALELQEDDEVDVHICMDVTQCESYLHDLVNKLNDNPKIYVFTYTSRQMEKEFPVLSEMQYRIPPISKRALVSHAWGFQVESIGLWWKQFRHWYKYIWVIEEDVGVTGSLKQFINSYNVKTEDLLCSQYIKSTQSWNGSFEEAGEAKNGWCWHDTASSGYTKLFADETRLHCPEHVIRLSGLACCLLDFLCRKKISAWSEQSIPTIINAYLRCGQFHPWHIGDVYGWNGKITQREWLTHTQKKDQHPQIWHPLKF